MRRLGWLALLPGLVWTGFLLFGFHPITSTDAQKQLRFADTPADRDGRLVWIGACAAAFALLALGVVVWRWARRAAAPTLRPISLLCWIMAGLAAFAAQYQLGLGTLSGDPLDPRRWGWQVVMMVSFVAAAVATMRPRPGSSSAERPPSPTPK